MKWIIFIHLLLGDVLFEETRVGCSPKNVLKRIKDNKTESSKQKDEKNGGKENLANSQIVGGISSNETRWPWQIAVLTLQDGKFQFRCGGSLINADVVLTAAHCLRNPDVTPSMVEITAGEYDQTFNDDTEQRRNVSKIKIHPGYVGTLSSLYSNDIALMKLTQPIAITESASTVSLATQNNYVASKAPCLITGWGISDIKKPTNVMATNLSQAYVKILTNDECNTKTHWDGLIQQYQICAYNKRTSACFGDSGGPLVCRVNDNFVQYGVTSWGSRSCDRKPSVFTRISYYYTWITDSIAKF